MIMEDILKRSVSYAGIFLRSVTSRSLTKSSTLRCLCLYNPKKWNIRYNKNALQNTFLPMYPYALQSETINFLKRTPCMSLLRNTELVGTFSSQSSDEKSGIKKPNIFQKMKQLTRDYWYILIPVHLTTSAVWITIFYVAAKNGVDVISFMEYIHTPEKYVDIIKNSNAGHWAVVYALYKIFTPLRYTVTVGGTTMSIRYLDKMGYLKFKRRSKEITSTNTANGSIKEKTSENSFTHSEQKRKRENQ